MAQHQQQRQGRWAASRWAGQQACRLRRSRAPATTPCLERCVCGSPLLGALIFVRCIAPPTSLLHHVSYVQLRLPCAASLLPGRPPHVLLLHPAACPCRPAQAAILSPDKKVDREYTPKLADAIRAPSPSGTLQPDGALPPVGDLFAPRPALPAYLSQGPASVPRLPEWDSRRPYLTGRFLYDAAVDSKGSSEGSRPPALDTYPAGVQESLREWHVLWVAVNVEWLACQRTVHGWAWCIVHVTTAGSPVAPISVMMLCHSALPTLPCQLPFYCPVVDDLLSAFLGLSGGYVRVKPLAAPGGQRLGYEVAAQGQLEPALAEMAARMLPIWCVLAHSCCCCCRSCCWLVPLLQ